MGLLQNGKWVDKWYDTKASKGRFLRQDAQFRNWITTDGSTGPTGIGGFKAEAGRYHLYVSYACPWAHRTLIFRNLKGLETMISLSVVNWYMGSDGWTFEAGEGVIGDSIHNAQFLHQVYTEAAPGYSGRVTVPVLWDRKTATIVSNESSEIIRMMNSGFDEIGAAPGDYYPEVLRLEIDSLNDRIYRTVNNGVYKAGFATTQGAYEEAVIPLFDTFDWLEDRLGKQRYLTGAAITEADWRLFTTLIRFDPVYVGHFKCNVKRLVDYPSLWGYVRDLYQQPGIEATVRMDNIKNHYHISHTSINPSGVVPVGPNIDWSLLHGRDH
ncbi:MAG: glutathione S-transferase family protein [Pseudomonadales bacterium]|nr:glutathione S-transferase family protein [Pseudomonadales bacterium]